MYDDCCKLTMYPLQMVLPLISQHVGTSQSSSTIGNNGSSRGHASPHSSYHLNNHSSSHHQHGHGSASSRLTTLSQHLPEELLNCIQPTLNHLAKSLANASKESKSSCGGGLTNAKPVCTASNSCTVPSIVWPPLQKPVRVKPATAQSGSGQNTPRKTWQSCTNLDVSPVVDCSEYPHLSEVLTGKCKLGTSQQCSNDNKTIQQCSNDARPSQQCSNDARLSQQCSNDARPSQQCSIDDRPSQQCSNDTRPSQQCSNDTRPSQQCSNDARPSQQCSIDARPSQQCSNDTRPSQQCSNDTRPSQQCSDDDRPSQQCSNDTRPSQQCSNDAEPSQQCNFDARPPSLHSNTSDDTNGFNKTENCSDRTTNGAASLGNCDFNDSRASSNEPSCEPVHHEYLRPAVLEVQASSVSHQNNGQYQGTVKSDTVETAIEHDNTSLVDQVTQALCDNVSLVNIKSPSVKTSRTPAPLNKCKLDANAAANCDNGSKCECCRNIARTNAVTSTINGLTQTGITGRKVVRKKLTTSAGTGQSQTSQRTLNEDTVTPMATKSDPCMNGKSHTISEHPISDHTNTTCINGTTLSKSNYVCNLDQSRCIDHFCQNGTTQTVILPSKPTVLAVMNHESLLGPVPSSNYTNNVRNTISPVFGHPSVVHNHSIEVPLVNKPAAQSVGNSSVDVSCLNTSVAVDSQHVNNVRNSNDVNKSAQNVSVNNSSSTSSRSSLTLGCETNCRYVERTSREITKSGESVHVMPDQPSCDIKHSLPTPYSTLKESTYGQETQPTHSKVQSQQNCTQSRQYNSSATENRDHYKIKIRAEFDEIYSKPFRTFVRDDGDENYGQTNEKHCTRNDTNGQPTCDDSNVLNDCLHCDQQRPEFNRIVSETTNHDVRSKSNETCSESTERCSKSNGKCTESNGNCQSSNENESGNIKCNNINQCMNEQTNTSSEYTNQANQNFCSNTDSEFANEANHISSMNGNVNTNNSELMNNNGNNSCRSRKLDSSSPEYSGNEYEVNGKTYQKTFLEYIDKSGRKHYRYGGYTQQPSRSSNSSPSNSSGSNSIQENYGSRYNRNQGYYSGYYQGGHYNNYGRHQGSLQSSRTNSYDDLKHNERFHDTGRNTGTDGRRSNSNSNISYNDNYNTGGSFGRTYKNNSNGNNIQHYYDNSGTYRRNYNEWRNGANNMQRRPSRYVDNKSNNSNSNSNNTGPRYWNNNGTNYTRQHYHQYQYNNNNNRNNNNTSQYNQQNNYVKYQNNSAKKSELSTFLNSSSGVVRNSKGGNGDSSGVSYTREGDNISPDHHGSMSSLSSSSNGSSGGENKTGSKVLKRVHAVNTNSDQVLATTSSGDQQQHRHSVIRNQRAVSPSETHHLQYDTKRRNMSSNGGLSLPYQHWGLKHTPLHPVTSNSAVELNFYLAMARAGSPLALHLTPPHPPPPLMTHVLASPTMLTDLPWHVPAFDTWDSLSKAIWTKFLSAQQTEKRFHQKMSLTCEVEKYVRFILREPHFRLFVVGSTMSGFGTDSSDIDMCLGIRPYEFDRVQAIRVLGTLERNKHHYVSDLFKTAELISAKVPILKFQDGLFKLEVDLNCNNVVGVRNTHLLYCYAQMDWRIRPLVLLVKLWAQTHNINDAKNMTISSYSLSLMVIHFLQCGTSPPVLPNLMTQYPGKFSPNSNIESIQLHETLAPYNSSNKDSLGTLLTQFFQYYSNFEYFKYAISVRRGAKISIEECRKYKSPQNKFNHWKYLCIEEPFDLTNTAHSVYDLEVFEHIRGVIRESSYLLSSSQDLNSIFESLAQQKQKSGFS